jgi:hypothetical protein
LGQKPLARFNLSLGHNFCLDCVYISHHHKLIHGIDHTISSSSPTLNTPLSLLAMDGDEAVSRAAASGYEAVMRPLAWRSAKLEYMEFKNGLLLYAAKNGSEAMVRLLLECGAEADPKADFCRTPLFFAAENGHEAVVKLLLEYGAEVNFKDNNGQTPLLFAAGNGHEAVVRLLLEYGTEADFKDNFGRTPLSFAAEKGWEAIAGRLLRSGAESNSKDNFGRTPLLFAVGNRHKAVVRLLLEYGAEVNFKDNDGRTLLSFAVENGWEAIAGLILRYLNTKYELYKLWQLVILLFNGLYSVFFFEWPDGQRLLSTTMPWNIPPSLLVLWGVCWMFAPYGQETRDRTGMEEGIIDIGLPPVNSSLHLVLRIQFVVIG